MKKIIFLFAIFAMVTSCQPRKSVLDPKSQSNAIKPEKNDDGEWDLEVFDTQWNYYLTAIAKPMSMYSESFLKTKNAFLVSEWNSYFFSGQYRNIIESSIDYNPNENYGLKFEYKLYQVFAYVNWKYGLRLRGLSGADAFRQ